MSAAPSWPLVIVALFRGERSEARLQPPPGFEFSSVFGPEAQFQGAQVLNLFFRPSERKTTRGALDRTRPSDRSHCGLQKPEIAYSPNDLRRQHRRPLAKPCFRAAAPIWGNNRGDSRVKSPNPHKFSCSVRIGASLLQAGLQKAGRPAIHVFGCQIPGSRFACTGMELKQASLISIPPSRQPSRAGS